MLARYEEDFEADSDATEEGEGERGAQGAAGGGATGGEDGVMEATLRDRGGAGQSCYGGFAACQVTRSTSELSDRSPGAAPVAAPEVAALEKTLKQLQLEVAACNQACNPVCRSPPPRVSSLQPCNPVWPQVADEETRREADGALSGARARRNWPVGGATARQPGLLGRTRRVLSCSTHCRRAPEPLQSP